VHRARRWILLGVAVFIVLLGVPLPSPGLVGTAHACSCFDPTTVIDRLRASADAVFLGTVDEIRRPEFNHSSDAETRFIFSVDAVYQGDSVSARQSIVTASDGAACGIDLRLGATAVVFGRAEDDEGEFASSLCEVIDNPSDAVLTSLGPSVPPRPGTSPIGRDDGFPSLVIRYGYWIVAAVAAALVAVIWRIHRSRRSRAGRSMT
jgi:hypothetical protein